MKKLSFWKADWFLGLIAAAIMLVCGAKAYDLGVQAASRAPSDRIAVIAIDDASIANIGRWPWSRDVHARMTDLLAGAKAKVIANTTFFFEPQRDAGLAYVERLRALQSELTVQTAAGPGKASSPNDALSQMGAVFAEAEQALNADRKKFVHRDIKPGNIMCEPDSDTVKVTDFGIARITDSSRTKTGMVLGTPSYMSSEQLAGKRVEGRSDLFSLGVTLYQMLCGGLPFQGDSMAQLMFKSATEPHADVRARKAGLPACVAAVTNKALAKNPDQRYQAGEQMAKAIRPCLGILAAAPRSAVAVS